MPGSSVLLLVGAILVSIEPSKALNFGDRCQTPKGEPGKCVPITLCDAITQLLPPNDEKIQEVANVVESFPSQEECGRFIQFHIYKGRIQEDTLIYDYPWVARIRYYKGLNRYGFHCSGVLIHSQYVLTTASCIEDVSPNWVVYQVRLGEHDTSTTLDCDVDCADPVRDVLIADFMTHENYFREGTAYYNDIAVLKLIEPVEFTDFIRPICLPIAPGARQANHTGQHMTIAGWGQKLDGSVSTRKQQLNVRVLSDETCANAFSSLQIDILHMHVCAEGGGKKLNACRSEAGGPLIRRGDGGSVYHFWYLVGLASFGMEQCRTDGMPVVYTRLSEYMDWVQDVMSAKM